MPITLLLLALLASGCEKGATEPLEESISELNIQTTVSKNEVEEDPLLFALVVASQPNGTQLKDVHTNDLNAIVLQQVGVGWAAKGRKDEARWAFRKGIDYARRTRQKSGSRLRGMAESCLDSLCPEEAVEAARFLRVEDRCRILAMAAGKLQEEGHTAEARAMLEEAERRLGGNFQAGGSAKERAYRAIAVTYYKMGDLSAAQKNIQEGCQFDKDWPNVVMVRNHLEVAEMYRDCGMLSQAKKHAHVAEGLCKKSRDESLGLLTATLLKDLGEDESAVHVVERLRSARAESAQVAQGYVRVGKPGQAMDYLKGCSPKECAHGLQLVCGYFNNAEQRKRVEELVADLPSSSKDWQLLQAVADLCARTGDPERAYRYYNASLRAYKRDWPELWRNPHQRAFVIANFGRELAESKLVTPRMTSRLYKELLEPYKWPQEVKL